ncbi:MAG TPA: hypothetical protein VK707_00570 [Solirubrobacteraceae bacterium]|jgi:hypothetical protein|nr:hypothetical protein [Solirubrobacteraceae bacterium]
MSDLDESPAVNGARDDGGVLGNLPRARPQRASARRAAERNGASARNGARKTVIKRTPRTVSKKSSAASERPVEQASAKRSVKPVGESAASSTAKASRRERVGVARGPGSTRRPAAKRPRSAPVEEPAPRQGFESESEAPSGSVHPPGGVELVASAAELVGELAKAGVSTGERFLKDVLSRLPL